MKRGATMRAVMDSTGLVHKIRQKLEDIELHQMSEMKNDNERCYLK